MNIISIDDVISMAIPESPYIYEDVIVKQIPQIQGQPWIFLRSNGTAIGTNTNSPIVPTPEQNNPEAATKVAEFVQQHGVPQQWAMYK